MEQGVDRTREAGHRTTSPVSAVVDEPPVLRLLEFTGLPGAGKSTVAALLTAELQARGLVPRSGEPLARLWSPHLVSTLPELVPGGLRLACSAAAPFAGARRALYLARLVAGLEAALAPSAPAAPLILEHGPLNHIWSLAVLTPAGRPASIHTVSRSVLARLKPVVVFLDARPQVAAERVRGRPFQAENRFDRADPGELVAGYQRDTPLLREIVGLVDQSRLVVASAHPPADVVAQGVVQELEARRLIPLSPDGPHDPKLPTGGGVPRAGRSEP